ncbi:MAG TPA: HEAT repeat domain-containing protein, partial [Polyangiaceae bacterium]|nr:HEAT repeat domain-containing protein [Polyangiaceae bacterium]
EVLKSSRYGVPTRGRRAAVSALASLSDSKKTREHLEDLLDDKDPHFRISVVDALVKLGDTKARGALRRALERELDGRVMRRLREALRDMGDASPQDRRRLGDDVETLRGELAELKQRLAKVEARRPEASPKRKAKGAVRHKR